MCYKIVFLWRFTLVGLCVEVANVAQKVILVLTPLVPAKILRKPDLYFFSFIERPNYFDVYQLCKSSTIMICVRNFLQLMWNFIIWYLRRTYWSVLAWFSRSLKWFCGSVRSDLFRDNNEDENDGSGGGGGGGRGRIKLNEVVWSYPISLRHHQQYVVWANQSGRDSTNGWFLIDLSGRELLCWCHFPPPFPCPFRRPLTSANL